MTYPTRPETERLLRQAGFSSRQAKKLLSGGWRLVVGTEAAANDELIEILEQATKKLKRKHIE